MLTCCGVSGTNPRSILTSNHAALVNKVYPTDPGETGPRPSHLSTLLSTPIQSRRSSRRSAITSLSKLRKTWAGTRMS
ncbi:hypothetical protein BCR33DRAFT_581294 [Rhizoclosmatium globosum]|uniref:Uncharacterized protein n=1 Tax=Rhizoclosmatium globosum TaxID=329046 RepID=A0A1Y2CQQ0_9FUNG|nr:hypothetical protein BCR33DRAFT_581294 [Rhizoclosmatium globosum]|eukprot:ORY49368.1 hypothetical protein BCR33DRAFT_581294 [Rhizoclosmatium globosum]